MPRKINHLGMHRIVGMGEGEVDTFQAHGSFIDKPEKFWANQGKQVGLHNSTTIPCSLQTTVLSSVSLIK